RQRQAEEIPAPHHETQTAMLDQQCNAEGERPEALAEQTIELATALLLDALEAVTGEIALPCFVAFLDPERHFHRHVASSAREAEHRRGKPRQQTAAAIDLRHAFGNKIAMQIVQPADRLWQRIECIAEQPAIKRRAARQWLAKARDDFPAREQRGVI